MDEGALFGEGACGEDGGKKFWRRIRVRKWREMNRTAGVAGKSWRENAGDS